MLFDIYGILKDSFELFVKAKGHLTARFSYSRAFKKAIEDCKENRDISKEFSAKLVNSKKPRLQDAFKHALNTSEGARELEISLHQILMDADIESAEKENSYFFSRLFFYLLQTAEYSKKIISMRADVELSENHQMLKRILIQEDGNTKKIQSPRILTRYAPKIQEQLVGRENDLKNILVMLNEKSKIVIVNGMGGIGKTALCRELFYDREIISQLAWVNYKGNLLNDLVEQFYFPIFSSDCPYSERLDRLLLFLWEEIKETAFLFVDNVNVTEADDQNLHILDSFRCKVICTSRIRRLGSFSVYDLDFLNESKCIELFENYYRKLESDEERENVKKIVELSGFHTLTIEAIAKVSLQDGLSPMDIFNKLENDGFNLSEAVAQITHRDEVVREATVIDHLKYVFDISSLDKDELKVLKVLSIFPNMPVPADIYRWFNLSNMNLFIRLTKYAWLKKTDNGFFMHHVIKEVIKSSCRITLNDCKNIIDYFIRHLASNESTSIMDYNNLLPFAEFTLNYFSKSTSAKIGLLCISVGQAYYYTGKLSEAMVLLDKAYKILAKTYSNNNKNIFSIFCIQATIENCFGHFKRSEQLYKKAMQGCEASEYVQTTLMADIYRDIATNYDDLEEFSSAIQYGEKALEIYKQHSSFLDMASVYNNLGLTHYYNGEHEKAFDCYLQAETMYKGRIPDNHQDFATLYNNMAMILCDNGELDAALEYHLRALNIRNKFENENHMDLSQTYNNIATVFFRKSSYEKAIEFQVLDITILEKINSKHPYLKQSYQKMAVYYAALDNSKKVKEYLEKLQSIDE
ncbi:MAG: tetratricopeptide repeat protein [Clostridia bacterium]|nr:tetratricopeptide repeat protein [Clostridia bacterium]